LKTQKKKKTHGGAARRKGHNRYGKKPEPLKNREKNNGK